MIRVSALIGVGLLLAGCSSAGFDRFGGGSAPSLPPAPTTPVQSQTLGTLPPVGPYGTQTYPTGTPIQNSQTGVAQTSQPINNAMGAEADFSAPVQNDLSTLEQPVPASARALKRTDLLGAWTLTSGAEQCKLNINLTNWSGGYRASTRGCSSSDLQRINAWRLDGEKLVVFIAEDGTSILARFSSIASGRFDGRAMQDSRVLSFFR